MRRPTRARLSMDMSLVSLNYEHDAEEKTGYEVRWQNSVRNLSVLTDSAKLNVPSTRPALKRSLSWSSHHSSHKGYDSYYHDKKEKETTSALLVSNEKSSRRSDSKRDVTASSRGDTQMNGNKSSSNLVRNNTERGTTSRSKSTERPKTPRRKPVRTKSIPDNIQDEKPMRRRTKEPPKRRMPRRTQSSDEVIAGNQEKEGGLPRRTKTAPSTALSRTKSSRSFRRMSDQSMKRMKSRARLMEDTSAPALDRANSSDKMKRRGSVSKRSKSSRKIMEDRNDDDEATDAVIRRRSKSPARGVRRAVSATSKTTGRPMKDSSRNQRTLRSLNRSGSIKWERGQSERHRRMQRSKSSRVVAADTNNNEEKTRKVKDRRAMGQNQKSFRNLNHVALAQVQQLERHQRREADFWKAALASKQREIDIEKALAESGNKIEITGTNTRKEKEGMNNSSDRSDSSRSLHLTEDTIKETANDDLDDSVSVMELKMELNMSKPFLSDSVFDL